MDVMLYEMEMSMVIQDEPKRKRKEEKAEEPKESGFDSDNQDDVSNSDKIRQEIEFDCDIKDDSSHEVIEDAGIKHVVLDEENKSKIASVLWDKLSSSMDMDFLKSKKQNSSLSFYVESKLKIKEDEKLIRIFFDINDNEFEIKGWSLDDIVSSKTDLDELDEKIEGFIGALYAL